MISGTRITSLRRVDVPELSEYLIDNPATAYRFSHEALLWKYFDGPGGPTEDSACSLIGRAAGKIVGHVGICPRQFIVSGDGTTPVSTMKPIDWRASAEYPGLGVFLMLRAFATCTTQYGLGGSAQTEAIMPQLGLERKHGIGIYRKVLTPFHRMRTTHQGLIRKCAGTARDLASILRVRTLPTPQIVELRPAPAFTSEVDCIQRQSSYPMVTCRRDHLLLNYFLRCPLSGFSGWTVHTSQRMIGFAVLKITSHERSLLGKIVDCWLDAEAPCFWQAAVAAMIDRFRALAADSITCYATTPSLRSALIWNGFAKSSEKNVYIRDKQQALPPDLPFGLSLLEGDHAIL
jgi:hypothetical protein